MKFEQKRVDAELVVVGAGIPGICAAVQAARMGVKTVLINDRGVVGGNSSCEIGVSLNGSNDGGPLNLNSREGGIIEEIRQEFKFRSPHNNRYALDGVLMDLIYAEKNLSLYLNLCIDEADTDENGRITCVHGTQNTAETRWTFTGKWFIDDTGDGALGALSNAEFMLGREGKAAFGEKIAPDEADSFCTPSTMIFSTKDMGFPVKYVAPDYADDIEASGALERRVIPHDKLVTMWYYELAGDLDQVKDREEILRRHRGLVAGIWNYIKNSGKYPEAENYDFDYISCIPGMREYRRLTGDYILTEKQIVQQEEHDDAVGHGGWNIDLHAIQGFYDTDIVNRHIHFQGPYQIPYRSGYSKNVENLFMCGRCMSTSHVAFGSTRVVATLATLGQAVGLATVMCKEYGITPRGVYQQKRRELQQRLLREDQLILGVKNEDPADLALKATATASSVLPLRLKPYEGAAFTPTGEGFGLVLPVKDKLETLTLTLTLRARKAVTLSINVYRPFRPYGFGPDELVSNLNVEVPVGENEVALPLKLSEGGRYYFIELIGNEHVDLLTAANTLPTTMMFRRYKNHGRTNWDYKTMDMADYAYSRTDICACFTTAPEQPVYGAENVVNGWARACGQPNMWVSDAFDAAPVLRVSWNSPVKLSLVQLTFGVDTTVRIRDCEKPIQDGTAMDYRIFACLGEKRTLVATVKDNHKKRNRLSFDSVECDALQIIIDRRANDAPVAIYELRAES